MIELNLIENETDLKLACHELGVIETELEMQLKSNVIDYDEYNEMLKELLKKRKQLKQKEKELKMWEEMSPKI